MFVSDNFQLFVHENITPYLLELDWGVDEKAFSQYVTRMCRFDLNTYMEYALVDTGKILGHLGRGKEKSRLLLIGIIDIGEDSQVLDLPETPFPINEIAVWALAEGWKHDPNIHALLREWAQENEYHNIRYTALDVLAEYYRDDPQTLPLIQDVTRNDEDAFVRSEGVFLLADVYCDDPQTFDLLYHCATKDEHEYVRSDAKTMLGEYFRKDPRMQALERTL